VEQFCTRRQLDGAGISTKCRFSSTRTFRARSGWWPLVRRLWIGAKQAWIARSGAAPASRTATCAWAFLRLLTRTSDRHNLHRGSSV